MSKFADKRENGKQMKLVDKIDKLVWRIDMATEMLEIKKEQLYEVKERKLYEKNNAHKKSLYNLEVETSSIDKIIAEQTEKVMPKFDDKQHWELRAFTQKLRFADEVVDKAGKIIEGKTLSSDSVSKVEEFKQAQKATRDAKLAEIANACKEKDLTAEVKSQKALEYNEKLAKTKLELAELEKVLTEKNNAIYTKFVENTNENLAKWKTGLSELQVELNSMLSAEEVNLPEDVILRLDALTMQFGGLKAVNELSFDVKKGEIFGLIGPNGAGKTTVFNCITQFYKPTFGEVYYRNRENKILNLNAYKVHDVIKTGIVRTFQNVEVIVELTILQNLLIAAHTQYKSSIFSQFLNSKAVKQEEAVLYRKAIKVLEYCDLLELKDQPPMGLPYGILKRIELARTLMAGANLIILDEPAAGLNDQETMELAERIKKIRAEFNVTVFLVEHDMGLVMDVCDHICAIAFGKKLSYGTATEIQADPVVQEAYLGAADKDGE